MKPTVGRTVHYYEKPAGTIPMEPLAAIITQVRDDVVALTVLPPFSSPYPRSTVLFSETPKAGCWSWPPRGPAPEPLRPSSEGQKRY